MRHVVSICALPSLLVALGLAPEAWAATPDRVAWSSAEGTTISSLAVSDDGRWVVFHEKDSDQIRLLDTTDWEVSSDYAACSGASAAGVAIAGSDGDYRVFFGCSDGHLIGLSLTDEDGLVTLSGTNSSSSSDTGWDSGYDDTDTSGEPWSTPITLADAGAVVDVQTDGATVFAIAEQEGGNDRVHAVDISSGGEYSSGYPSAFGQSGFADAWMGSSYLFVSHGNQKVSKVDITTGSISVSTENISADMGDMDAINDSAAFLADANGGVIKYLPNGGSDNFQILLDEYNAELQSVSAIVLDQDDGFVAVYDSGASSGGDLVLYTFESSNLSIGTTELERFEAQHISEMVRRDGYVIAGGETGVLQVITALPWVEIASVSPSAAISGEEVIVTFSSDMDGSWRLYQGGGEDGDGEELASGDCEAGVDATATFTVDSSFEEGDNDLWLRVTGSTGTGHDRSSVNVDNPPGAPTLTSEGVGFGNSQITVAFEGIDDADLVGYDIYLTTEEFSADDWPEGTTGGPDFDGPDDLDFSFPIEITKAPGDDVNQTISPLTNGVTYYVAVRAIDEGGQESAMSNVVSVTPQETIGAAELAGETGGYCGTRTPWSLAALGLAGLLVARRRRGALAAILLLGLAAPRAMAASNEDEHPRANGDIELRYGPYFPSSEAVTTVYGSSGHQVLWLEGGVKVTRFAELDLGAGFYQELSTLVSAADSSLSSAEHTMLTAFPLTGALTFRLDVFHEQFLVPTARVGLDYWLWRENWYVNPDVGGGSEMSGGELGVHYGFGVNLLLDRFDARRADWLATSTGIDDTYLVVDWRTQTFGAFDSGDGVSLLDGSMVTVGLKLDM
jgi:hypothetical protein